MPKIVVKLTDEEENGIDGEFWDVNAPFPSDSVPCYDPGNMRVRPNMPLMTAMKCERGCSRGESAETVGEEFVRDASHALAGDSEIYFGV